MSERLVTLEISRIEAAHLSGLVTQFLELLQSSDDARPTDDPAIARLVPDAYTDDPHAAREFRDVTQTDLITRRIDDAGIVLSTLGGIVLVPAGTPLDDPRFTELVSITIDADESRAWLRTLAAIRLVLASRLGIETEDDHDEDDTRFGIYDWLGYRLDGLVRAVTED
ncbi:DUF2017 family protein [Microbacterium rhizomatis]|uniref:DUF2017 family protein n=1 Tax=Microbacterium rhizomatis TaxID=1631477 RepID=A0A5J5J6T0_9MICO|nr:DUF2017 family protein [Microbacterium rhizomatis]KAA9110685.1 DUF2017 family protein [Microbacterium rhizomatis]